MSGSTTQVTTRSEWQQQILCGTVIALLEWASWPRHPGNSRTSSPDWQLLLLDLQSRIVPGFIVRGVSLSGHRLDLQVAIPALVTRYGQGHNVTTRSIQNPFWGNNLPTMIAKLPFLAEAV